MKYFEDTWKVVDTYFKTNPYFLTKHHLESWDNFALHKLQNTIHVLNPFTVLKKQGSGGNSLTHEINVYIGGIDGKEISVSKPTYIDPLTGEQNIMYPNDARLRDMTYQSDIFANIVVRYITKKDNGEETVEEDFFKDIKIGALPIMLHSKMCILHNQPFDALVEMGECPYDQGGYFIIDGKEKVIVAQERIALNRIFINKSKDPKYSHEGLIRCTSDENPLFPKTIKFFVNRDNLTDIKTDKDLLQGKLRTPNAITISIPNMNVEIPLFVLFRALGVESDKEIIDYITYDTATENTEGENTTSVITEAIQEFLRWSIIDAHNKNIMNQEQAIRFLQQYVEYKDVEKVKNALVNDIFPNMGASFHNKALFMGHVVNKLVKTRIALMKESDRDNYVFKRVDISGFLIGNLFRDYYNQFRNTVRNTIDKEYLYGPWRTSKYIKNLINRGNLHNIFRASIIEDGFMKSLKGRWGKSMIDENQSSDDIKDGVVQDLSRISYIGTVSHLRRLKTPIDPTSKVVGPHRLHSSQWGIVCPIESPDGGSIGLIKHFSTFGIVTFGSSDKPILACLNALGMKQISNIQPRDMISGAATKILINNNWIGSTQEPKKVYTTLKLLKRSGLISIYTSIAWNILSSEISICTEAGRCVRPIYVVDYDEENNKNVLPIETAWKALGNNPDAFAWSDLCNMNKEVEHPEEYITKMDWLLKNQAPIEYIDVEETNNGLIAMNGDILSQNPRTRYTHCEIHPSAILSTVMQNIPMANHNQAPRNIFYGAQSKQAVGTYMTSFAKRIDTMSYVLHYPQRSLVGTRYMDHLHNNVLCGGENLIVAIATYTGYNQEDSIIINRAAIERGMFNMTYFKSVIEKEGDVKDAMKRDSERIVFANPLGVLKEGKNLLSVKQTNYAKTLDENGLPKKNVYIREGDAVIGKCQIQTEYIDETEGDGQGDNNALSLFGNKKKVHTYRDMSKIADKTISGFVDKVFVYYDKAGVKTCKMRLRKVRIPDLGDKAASRHGQKGVFGMIMNPEDMPYNSQGIAPDIIINPHAFPTRMTIGHLLECILAKTCTYRGMTVDATTFQPQDYESIYSTLEKDFGIERYGNEILYNGFDGTQMETEIFFGPTYYQRLKHQVADKINYRTRGPVNATTRQPTKGRGNNGGLRIGEMEKDSILSHGLSAFLKESTMERSDKYKWLLNNETGQLVGNDLNPTADPTAPDNTNIDPVETPYAFKLFMQEIQSMGIAMKMQTAAATNDLDDDDDDEHYADLELVPEMDDEDAYEE